MKYLFFLLLISLLLDKFYSSFQSSFFHQINKDKKGENIIISPLSAFQALSLMANGAKEQTLKEMLEVLQSDSLEDLNEINYKILSVIKQCSTIEIANAIMTRFTPLDKFIEMGETYDATIEPLKSVEQVNEWCNNKTHGKIDKILDKLDQNTILIILNAVYFKGEWVNKFLFYSTKKLPFYNFGTEEINIDTMDQIAHFNYYEDKKLQAIELRFKEDYMSALIILPAEGNDINDYIDSLSFVNEEYNKIFNGLQNSNVHIQLPKFELSFSQELNEILRDLGMYDAFSLGNADFSDIKKEKDLYIYKVLQKTYLKVFEDGCEAAAVTIIEGWGGSGMPIEEKIYDMKINRPFLFMLKNSRLPVGLDLVFMSKIEKLE